MSRSYKKNPIHKDSNKWAKKYANKVVRRTKTIHSGKSYRKIFNSWDICDWSSRQTLNDLYRYMEERTSANLNGDKYSFNYSSEVQKTEEIQRWHKFYLRK